MTHLTTARRFAAALVIAGLPLVVAPVLSPATAAPIAEAAPQQCRQLTSGSVDWGLKQSFRHYLTGPIARGGWDLNGVDYNGDPGGQGAFHFTADPAGATIDGENADIPLNGSVHFTGHFGLLDVTMRDLVLQIRGDKGQLVGSFGRGGAVAELSSIFKGGDGDGQVPIATFTLDNTLPAATDASGNATLTGTAVLTEDANQAMGGNYGEGNNDADPVTINLATTPASSCGTIDAAPIATPAAPAATETPAATPTPAPAPAAATPQPQECAEANSVTAGWGIKQSFRRYLTGPIANGKWELSGVGFSGEPGGPDSTFDFTAPQGATPTGDGATIPLRGEITFTGHLGLLKIHLSNMSIQVHGNQASFVADFESNTVSSFNKGATVTGQETGTQAAIATFTLDAPYTSGPATLSGPGVITAEGNRAFGGNYGEGNNQADPLHLVIGGNCASQQNTPQHNKPQQTSPQQTQPQTQPEQDLTKPPLGMVNLNQPRQQQQGAQPGAQQPAATTATTGTCDASTTKSVSDARMGWGVKDSFRTYIRGPIAKGGWKLDNVTEAGGAFIFSGNQGAVDTAANRGSVKYSGAVTFYGHDGVLNTTIANPEITFNGAAGVLTADVQSNDTNGNPASYGRIPLADLSLRASLDGSVLDGSASASLTQQGAAALGNFYEPGTALSPVSFKAALSGSGDCAAIMGSNTNTARISAPSGPKAIKGKDGDKDKLSPEDLASFGKDGEETQAPGEDGSRTGSRTSLLDEPAVENTSVAMAFAQNPATPVALALLVIAAGGLITWLATGRRRQQGAQPE